MASSGGEPFDLVVSYKGKSATLSVTTATTAAGLIPLIFAGLGLLPNEVSLKVLLKGKRLDNDDDTTPLFPMAPKKPPKLLVMATTMETVQVEQQKQAEKMAAIDKIRAEEERIAAAMKRAEEEAEKDRQRKAEEEEAAAEKARQEREQQVSSGSRRTFTDSSSSLTDPGALAAYQSVQGWLQQKAGFFAVNVVPSVVNLRDLVADPLPPGEDIPSLVNNSDSGVELLTQALEGLEGLDKGEATLLNMSPWTVPLTQLVTYQEAHNPQHALEQLQACASVAPRKVCQYPFKKNDILWMCRTCQADETCAMCHECYTNSNHEGHDVAFFHAQEGGCCDCGDPDAWDPKGFCRNHGQDTSASNNAAASPEATLPADLVRRVQGIVPAVMDFMVQRVAQMAQDISERTKSTRASVTLGEVGRQGHGLYLVVVADDIHICLPTEWMDALREIFGSSSNYNDDLMTKLKQSVTACGQMIVFGTMELAAACGSDVLRQWLVDGDSIASETIVTTLLQRAALLTGRGFSCRIVTLHELHVEQQAIAVMQWLAALAFTCDPLCQTVADSIHTERHLVPILEADLVLASRFTKAWYSTLLTLLAVPSFKSSLGAAYCNTYPKLIAQCALGVGVLEKSAFALSVQFLNRDTYVLELVQNRNLLGTLGKCFLATLQVAQIEGTKRLDAHHVALSHRRYSPCISDLNYVISIKDMKRLITCERGTFLDDFVAGLSLAQFMDEHSWRHWDRGHVEEEDFGWYGAFNLGIALGGLFERLLGWKDDDKSPILDKSSPLASGMLTMMELTSSLLIKGISQWQQESICQNFSPTTFYSAAMDVHRRRSASLPLSTIAAKRGCTLAMKQLPVGQVTPFSLHIPLHRFLAACLRELCLRPTKEAGVDLLMKHLSASVSEAALDQLFFGLMEFPTMVMSRAAQVKAGLWRRNGPGLNEQISQYSGPTFCRYMRDSDLILIQFAVLRQRMHLGATPRPDTDVSMAIIVHLLLHRLGLFDFAGLDKAPDADLDAYESELLRALYPRESGQDNGNKNGLVLPWTYTAARDAADCRALMEEFLYTLIIFVTELPPPPPVDDNEHIEQAKSRLQRQVIHRLAASPKTHSELADIHLLLSYSDNLRLAEEGKKINPDDATAAMLGKILAHVADRKSSRNRLEPDKFVLRKESWKDYDPSFYHISVESHQTAAENRPVLSENDDKSHGMFGPSNSYAPAAPPAHPSFARLRRDVTADATVLAVVYRLLHMHCSEMKRTDVLDLRNGRIAYESEAKSEMCLARAVHILTVGCYAWETSTIGVSAWRETGGGSPGSMFFDKRNAPSVGDWIFAAFLTPPHDLVDCNWYEGEENTLLLLKRLAIDGGAAGNFSVQDPAVKAGAAWLCEFAVKHCPAAAALVGSKSPPSGSIDEKESEMDRKKGLAKERALAQRNAQASKFASALSAERGEAAGADDDIGKMPEKVESDFERRKREAKEKAVAKINKSATIFAEQHGIELTNSAKQEAEVKAESEFEKKKRLAKERALATINSHATKFAAMNGLQIGEEKPETEMEKRKRLAKEKVLAQMNSQAAKFASMMEIQLGNEVGCAGDTKVATKPRKALRERPQCIICSDSDAECFVAFSQGSTVLKGGGGPHTDDVRMSPVRRLVGSYVSLCGHAIHSDCSASYLAKVQQNADDNGSSDEFRCPLCQRPSNCLVPFVEVGVDWIDSPTGLPSDAPSGTLDSFLSKTKWWTARCNASLAWDGQSAFFDGTSTTTIGARIAPEATVEQVVLLRLLDQISDIAYEADLKRLGEDKFWEYCGEFRHHIIEKHVYNEKQNSEECGLTMWPDCLYPGEVPMNKIRCFAREKVLSQLLTSIQTFTYSCCCDASEARQNIADAIESSQEGPSNPQVSDTLRPVFSKFGIGGSICDGRLILMPTPSAFEDEGAQPFNGRLGRLRCFALAVMAAAGAAGADLVQIALQLPAKCSRSDLEAARAPLAYPILLGHVLTHVVAAMCATSGRSIAPKDWVATFSDGAESALQCGNAADGTSDSIFEDCQGFLQLGVLARALQVLLCELHISPSNVSSVLRAIRQMKEGDVDGSSTTDIKWLLSCALLAEVALSNQAEEQSSDAVAEDVNDFVHRFRRASLVAAGAIASLLSDGAMIVQVLIPRAIERYSANTDRAVHEKGDGSDSTEIFEQLRTVLRFDTIAEMLESNLVREVVTNWCDIALDHTAKESSQNQTLWRTHGFRSFDWPIQSSNDYGTASGVHALAQAPMGGQKTIPLIGGFISDVQTSGDKRPCINALTSSYMDLYAKIVELKPDSERTAVCLICGEALDASGKGECTRHSYKCGAGTGIFFLLQDCVGLIMHRSEGSYIHSIYVDSHGETPRGRPLYLDLVRYNRLRDLWRGHLVKQQVITERESTQQGTVRDFY